MSDSEPSALVNRYIATDEWREVDKYFTSTLVREDDALVAARGSGAATTMPNAEVAANQGAFSGLLAEIAGAKRVLEFGTSAGYSTIWFARAVGENGRVITLELEPQNAAVAEANFLAAGVAERIETVVGPAAEPDSTDPRIQGVRRAAEDIAANPELDSTALQTVGVKGWDGLIIARRR